MTDNITEISAICDISNIIFNIFNFSYYFLHILDGVC